MEKWHSEEKLFCELLLFDLSYLKFENKQTKHFFKEILILLNSQTYQDLGKEVG